MQHWAESASGPWGSAQPGGQLPWGGGKGSLGGPLPWRVEGREWIFTD